MATTEVPIKVEKDDSPQPFSKNLISSAIRPGHLRREPVDRGAADGKMKREHDAQGSSLARDAGQDESLLARRKLSLHRSNLPL